MSRVYAGQTIQGLARLNSHKSRKEFWNKAVMFLDEDWNIDRDTLDALEAMAIDYVCTHGSYEADNCDKPNPRLSPYKEQRVESLHRSILFRMETLGYDLDRVDEGPVTGSTMFHTRRNGVRGIGVYDKDTGAFTVLAGSEIDLDRTVIKLRAAINARSQLFSSAKGGQILDIDLTFTSPSAAAVFVLGGSANGWTEWVNDQGMTLDSIYRHGDRGGANE